VDVNAWAPGRHVRHPQPVQWWLVARLTLALLGALFLAYWHLTGHPYS
jgi:hypothetical protein